MLLNRILRPQRSPLLASIKSSTIQHRKLSSSTVLFQNQQPQSPKSAHSDLHRAYYRTHGRALFKSLTLAFLSYQIFYWIWLTLETEAMKDEKSEIIHSLQSEVKLLSSGQGSHVLKGEKNLLDEDTRS